MAWSPMATRNGWCRTRRRRRGGTRKAAKAGAGVVERDGVKVPAVAAVPDAALPAAAESPRSKLALLVEGASTRTHPSIAAALAALAK